MSANIRDINSSLDSDSISLLQKAANTIRVLSMDGVQAANSGHPGMPMGMADVAALLWTRYMEHNPANPNWADRDRFILSAGHGSMLIYSLLHLTGYDLPLDELKNFRQWDSKTPRTSGIWSYSRRRNHYRSIGAGYFERSRLCACRTVAGQPL